MGAKIAFVVVMVIKSEIKRLKEPLVKV